MWQWPSDRVSDKKATTGKDRASYQAREPIEGDEERLAMRQGDMPSTIAKASFKSENPRRSSITGLQEHGLITAEASFHSA